MNEQRMSDRDIVQTYCDAWMAADAVAILTCYHDDLTLDWFGTHHLAGTHTGMQASLDALLNLQAATNREPVEVEQILSGPDSVIAVVRERWTSPTDPSQVLEHQRALEFTVADGKLRTCRIYETAQAEIDEWLGLRRSAVRLVG